MTVDLFSKILPTIEEAYTAQAMSATPPVDDEIRVIVPVPTSLLGDVAETLETVCAKLGGVPWIDAAGTTTEPIKNTAGETVFDPTAHGMTMIDVLCKPFRAVHLS